MRQDDLPHHFATGQTVHHQINVVERPCCGQQSLNRQRATLAAWGIVGWV